MKTCKKCGRRIPNNRKKCVYCYKRKSIKANKLKEELGAVILAASDALARSAATRTSGYRYYADLFKDSKKRYRG